LVQAPLRRKPPDEQEEATEVRLAESPPPQLREKSELSAEAPAETEHEAREESGSPRVARQRHRPAPRREARSTAGKSTFARAQRSGTASLGSDKAERHAPHEAPRRATEKFDTSEPTGAPSEATPQSEHAYVRRRSENLSDSSRRASSLAHHEFMKEEQDKDGNAHSSGGSRHENADVGEPSRALVKQEVKEDIDKHHSRDPPASSLREQRHHMNRDTDHAVGDHQPRKRHDISSAAADELRRRQSPAGDRSRHGHGVPRETEGRRRSPSRSRSLRRPHYNQQRPRRIRADASIGGPRQSSGMDRRHRPVSQGEGFRRRGDARSRC